jgi:GAF domain-containing protein
MSLSQGRATFRVIGRDDSGAQRLADSRVTALLGSAQEVLEDDASAWALLRPGREAPGGADVRERLHEVVDATRELTHARFAGLGSVTWNGQRRSSGERHGDGASDPAPGVVGLAVHVVAAGRALRMRGLAADPALVGSTADQRGPVAFLGVPLLCGGRPFGYLYVADKQQADEFTDDDEELLVPLAAAVAAVLDPEAAEAVASDLDAPPAGGPPVAGRDPSTTSQRLARTAQRLLAADAAAIVLPDADGAMRVAAVEGDPWTDLAGGPIPADRSLSALAMRARWTQAVADAATDPRTAPATRSPEIGPLLAAPVLLDDDPRAVLTVGRREPAAPFTKGDAAVLTELATHAGLGLDTADEPGPPSRDRAPTTVESAAVALDADLTQRLILYAATMHTLSAGERRSRIVGELLRQASELHHQVQAAVGVAVCGAGGRADDP